MKSSIHFMLAALAIASGCSPEAFIESDVTLDFSGSYTVTVTNGSNGCVFADWQEGQSHMNIPLIIEQRTANDVVARVEGIPGALLGLLHGTNQYNGKATGDALEMEIEGTLPGSMGNCSFTWSNAATATLKDDYLSGKIVYSRAHNGNSDCVPLTCQTEQHFNGTRPPSAPAR